MSVACYPPEKKCNRCEEWLYLAEYHKDKKAKDGRMGMCKACNKGRVTEWRSKKARDRRSNRAAVARYRARNRLSINTRNRDRYREDLDGNRERERERWHRRAAAGNITPKDPIKVKARKILDRAIRAGQILKPTECLQDDCEGLSNTIEAHHKDYSKPLDVEWACAMCHRRLFHATC